MTAARPVERPQHVHPTRMRHIADRDLAAAIGLPGKGIERIRAVLSGRGNLRPVWDPAAQATALGETEQRSELLAANALLEREVDFLSSEHGRSGLYGLHYLSWLRPLLLAYELTGDERFATGFGRIFDDWYACRDDVVGDWPGLDVVWYSLGVWARAELLVAALTCFGEATGLPDRTYANMLKTVLGGARWSVEEHAEFRHGNWQLLCAAELLHVAAFLPAATESVAWIDVGRARTVDHLERDFYADGGHYERSPGYHLLCLEALQRAAVVAEQHLGWRLDEHPRFTVAHDWLAAMITPSGWVPAWQDSPVVWPAVALLRGHYFHRRPRTKALVREHLTAVEIHAAMGVLPTRPGHDGPEKEFDAAPESTAEQASCHLADSGYVVLRGARTYLAVNAGHYVEHELESHSHLAVTDFVIDAAGAPLALEGGGPASYDDPRYQSWYRAPLAHNMVTVDGERISTERQCVVDEFLETGAVTVLRMHHDGYSRRVHRRIVFVGAPPAYWLVSDSIEDTGATGDTTAATWSVLAPVPWERNGQGFTGVGAPSLSVVPADRETTATFETGPGQLPVAGGKRYVDLHALRLHSARGRFDVLLVPSAGDRDPWRLDRVGEGWRITGPSVTDAVTDTLWRRASTDGETVAAQRWGR
jgi:hypothetical protein